MEVTELTAFEGKEGESLEEPLPEEPPDELLNGFIPPIKNREAIAPDDPICDVQTGDLLAIHVGADKLEHYGFLVLSAYATKLIGICLHNQNYASRDMDSWVEWYGEYEAAGNFESGEMRVYRDVAPIGDSDSNP